jgi:hypothetical protein
MIMAKPRKTSDRGRKTQGSKRKEHADGSTMRPETPFLEGREPLPEELTGRASGTDENLVGLFDNESAEHMTDGFQGGSQDIPEREARRMDADGITPTKSNEPEGTRD